MSNGRLEFDMKLILFILVFINYKLIYFNDLRKSYRNEAFINSFYSHSNKTYLLPMTYSQL